MLSDSLGDFWQRNINSPLFACITMISLRYSLGCVLRILCWNYNNQQLPLFLQMCFVSCLAGLHRQSQQNHILSKSYVLHDGESYLRTFMCGQARSILQLWCQLWYLRCWSCTLNKTRAPNFYFVRSNCPSRVHYPRHLVFLTKGIECGDDIFLFSTGSDFSPYGWKRNVVFFSTA